MSFTHLCSKIIKRFDVALNGYKIINGYNETVSRSLLSLRKYESAIEDCSKNEISLSDPLANSKTIFVLGSGKSINNLTSRDFDIISKHDSIGFNYWFVHDYTPSHYLFQWSPELMIMLKQNFDRLCNMNLIVRSIHLPEMPVSSLFNFLPQSTRLSFVPELAFHSRCSFNLEQIHILLQALSAFKSNSSFLPVPKFFATIGMIIPWAVRNGYKNIVLTGFDMDSSGYFWTDSVYSSNTYRFPLPLEGHAKLHASPRFMGITIPEYLAFSSKWHSSAFGVNIYSFKCSNLVSSLLSEFEPF